MIALHPNLEVEYKVLVTKEQFMNLLNLYPHHTINDQTNTYFDTTPSLKNRGIGCRIRECNGQYQFTLKSKVAEGHDEYEFYIPSFNVDEPKIQKILRIFDIHGLQEVGKLHTLRYFIDLKTAELCLDINTYNGITDYEIEYELKDPQINTFDEFMAILKSANIPYIPNPNSKIKRCLETR